MRLDDVFAAAPKLAIEIAARASPSDSDAHDAYVANALAPLRRQPMANTVVTSGLVMSALAA